MMTNATKHTAEYAGQTFSQTSKRHYSFAVAAETHNGDGAWFACVLAWASRRDLAETARAGFAKLPTWYRNLAVVPVVR